MSVNLHLCPLGGGCDGQLPWNNGWRNRRRLLFLLVMLRNGNLRLIRGWFRSYLIGRDRSLRIGRRRSSGGLLSRLLRRSSLRRRSCRWRRGRRIIIRIFGMDLECNPDNDKQDDAERSRNSVHKKFRRRLFDFRSCLLGNFLGLNFRFFLDRASLEYGGVYFIVGRVFLRLGCGGRGRDKYRFQRRQFADL